MRTNPVRVARRPSAAARVDVTPRVQWLLFLVSSYVTLGLVVALSGGLALVAFPLAGPVVTVQWIPLADCPGGQRTEARRIPWTTFKQAK
jgi:hypothetical protein